MPAGKVSKKTLERRLRDKNTQKLERKLLKLLSGTHQSNTSKADITSLGGLVVYLKLKDSRFKTH